MDKPADCSRRWLVAAAGSAGLLVSAPSPAFADMRPRQAAPGRKADAGKVPVTVTEDLMREHGVLDRVLLIYEASARRLDQGEDIEAALFTQAGEVMRDFVHGYHEKSEEDEIFPRFQKAGRMVDLVGVLRVQHAAGRQLTARMLAAVPGLSSAAERKAMIDAMSATITLYRPHAAREDTDLFPTLRSIVTPAEFEDLAETMEKREKEKLGPDGFEKAVKTVEAIEKRLGTHDLPS